MAISSRLLNQGESVVISTRTHWKALIVPVLALVVVLALSAFGLNRIDNTPGRWAIAVVAVVLLLWLTAFPFLRWLTSTYTITSRRLITRHGILTRTGHDIPLNRISDVSYERGVVDRILGCGTLIISDASTQGRVSLPDVPEVERAQLKISDLLYGHATTEHPQMTGPEQEYTREQLEAAILGAVPDLASEDVSSASGFSLEETRRFWRALGFADAGAQTAFGAADVKALTRIASLVESGLVDQETVLRMTRAVGHTVSRLAEWEVATLVSRVEELESGDQATGSRIGSALRMHGEIGSTFEDLLIYAWRRHLAAAVSRVEALGASDADLHTAEVTVGFADLVGFSAYSNEHTQDQIGKVVEDFESRASDAVALHGGRVIKTLGDSVLYVCADAVSAYDIAADVVRDVGGDLELPDVRVGLATGAVVLRLGDVFGPAVNLAARMTSVARRNRVIADERTSQLLPVEEFQLRTLPARPVRGFGDLEPVAVRRRGRSAQP